MKEVYSPPWIDMGSPSSLAGRLLISQAQSSVELPCQPLRVEMG